MGVSARRLVLFLIILGALESAAPCLAKEGTRATVERAFTQLASSDVTRRAAAAAVLAKHYPEGARGVPLLEATLNDEVESVRTAATAALRSLGAAGEKDLVAFLADTRHPQNRAFDKARRYIVQHGARSTPWGLAEIEGVEARVARFCLTPPDVLPSTERSVREVLRELLAGDASTFERAGAGLQPLAARRFACACLAVNGLRSLPTNAMPEPSKKLLALVSHADESVRWGALALLAILRGNHPKSLAALPRARPRAESPDVEAIIRKLPDPKKRRIYPIELNFLDFTLKDLFGLGAKAKAAIPRLKAILVKVRKDPDPEMQGEEYYVIAALCRIDGPTPERIDALLDGLEKTKAGDEYIHPRSEHAARALGLCAQQIEGDKRRARIARAAAVLLAHDSTRLQPALLDMLEPLGKEASPASDALVKLLSELEQALTGSYARRPGPARGSGTSRCSWQTCSCSTA